MCPQIPCGVLLEPSPTRTETLVRIYVDRNPYSPFEQLLLGLFDNLTVDERQWVLLSCVSHGSQKAL
jgi:hypothetical protein